MVQEALACNLPVISVDVGDTRERLNGVSQTRIVTRSPEALGAAIAEILEHPARSDGQGKVKEFCAQTIAADLRQIYERLVRRA